MFYTTKSLYEVCRIKTAATFLRLKNKAGLGGQAEFLFSSINAVVIGPSGLSDDPWVSLELYPVCFSNSRLLIGSDNQRRCGALRWLRCLETGGLRRGNIEDKSARDRKTRLCLLLHKHQKNKTTTNNLFNTWPTSEDLWRAHNQTGKERSDVWEFEPTVNRLPEKTLPSWSERIQTSTSFPILFFECAGRFSETVGFSIRRGSTFL